MFAVIRWAGLLRLAPFGVLAAVVLSLVVLLGAPALLAQEGDTPPDRYPNYNLGEELERTPTPTPTPEPTIVVGILDDSGGVSWVIFGLGVLGAFGAGIAAVSFVLFARGRGQLLEDVGPSSVEIPIIHAVEVSKTYDTGKVKVQALRGVNLTIERGEMVAIMGPSGCGKTTLLNCLSGLDIVDSGRIFVDGVDLSAMTDDEKTEYRARRMGFVFQFYNLLPVLSAVENVELPLLVSGMPAREARRRSLEALRRVHLLEWAHHKPAELSGGQRQRVTIARALVNNPAIVWGDEPTGDLDSKNAHEIMDLLCDLNEKFGQTFVLVTHAQEVAERTGRIIRMQDGQIISDQRALDKDAGIWAPSTPTEAT